MRKQKKLLREPFHLPFWATVLLLPLGALLITGIMFCVAPGNIFVFLAALRAHPTLFLWNYLPVLLAVVFLYFCYGKSTFAVYTIGVFLCTLAIGNRMKIALRDDPFVPSDLTLLPETFRVMGGGSSHNWWIIVLFAILVYLGGHIFNNYFVDRPISTRNRVIGALSAATIFMCMNHLVYTDTTLYDSYPLTGNVYYSVNHYNERGFLYSFLKDVNHFHVKKAEHYTASEYTQREAAFQPADYTQQVRPHIIMVMGESFSDISNAASLNFSGYTDPLTNYNALVAQDNVVSGHIIVPNFGGGTADTEFDVLTACPTRFINGDLISYSYVRQATEAVPSLLEAQGYHALAIHPGNSWFYNRDNVYGYLGFQERYFLGDSFDPATQNLGGYISDKAVGDKILATYEENLSTGNPLFSFTVTIQNHGPYTEKYTDQPVNFSSAVDLTPAETATLSGYFRGVADTDALLGRLTEYFSQTDEPVMVVFFGDHLPGFTGVMELFEKLGLPIGWDSGVEERLNVYATPFLIWQNDAALALGHSIPEDLTQSDLLLSANYLGAAALDIAGLDQLSALFSFTDQLRTELPVIGLQTFVTADGTYLNTPPAAYQADVDLLKGWAYYRLFHR